MIAFVGSLLFVVLAEMGDKTQLLAMAFATRYKAYQVLCAVFIATTINHSLAVAVGGLLTKAVPLDIISLIAAVSFILFGLWTLRGDSVNNGNKKESKFGPVATVAIAFFIAEMGDKTQLATISLAIKYRNLFGVLLGTTTGMVIADAIGIILGVVMRKHIPENIIKWVSAVIFMMFGLIGIYRILSAKLNLPATFSILASVIIATAIAVHFINKKTSEK